MSKIKPLTYNIEFEEAIRKYSSDHPATLCLTEIGALREELKKASRSAMCDVCAGVGHCGDRPCICGGSGLACDALTNLRVDYFCEQKELQKTKDALAEAAEDKQYAALAQCDESDALRVELAQSEKVIAGMRENAAAIAVRLGVDCEGMDDAATWHASAEAIEKLGKVAGKLYMQLLIAKNTVEQNFPGRCRLEQGTYDLLESYAAHKKDTQPGGGE